MGTAKKLMLLAPLLNAKTSPVELFAVTKLPLPKEAGPVIAFEKDILVLGLLLRNNNRLIAGTTPALVLAEVGFKFDISKEPL